MRKLYKDSSFYSSSVFLVIPIVVFIGMLALVLSAKMWLAAGLLAVALWVLFAKARRFYAWYAIPPQTMLELVGDTINTPDGNRRMSDIAKMELGILKIRKRMNYMATGENLSSVVRISFSDKSWAEFRAGPHLFPIFSAMAGDFGADDVADLNRKIDAISQRTGIATEGASIADLVL